MQPTRGDHNTLRAEHNERDPAHDWKQVLQHYGFVPTELGGMRGRIEDICVSAIEHPLSGVSVTATHYGSRTASQFETVIPQQLRVEDAGRLLADMVVRIHMEMSSRSVATTPETPTRERPPKDEALRLLPDLLQRLFRVVDDLEFLFERPFTPDGHMVGSIGETVAAFVYDLRLHDCSFENHDAVSADCRKVQIKLTCGKKRVGIYGQPEHLIVLQLVERKRFAEVYNGPGALVWPHVGKPLKNGQRPISLARLRGIQRHVPVEQRLPEVRNLADLVSRGAHKADTDVCRAAAQP